MHGLADAYVQRNVPLLRHLVLNKQPTSNAARENFRSLALRGGKRGRRAEQAQAQAQALRLSGSGSGSEGTAV